MRAVYGITNANGEIINRIVATEEFCEATYPGRWVFIEGIVEPEPPALAFPTLTRKELRNGLLSIGITSAEVEAQIAVIPDQLEREAAMIDWQDTKDYRRDHPLVVEIAEAMSLPPSQVDDLWRWAATI